MKKALTCLTSYTYMQMGSSNDDGRYGRNSRAMSLLAFLFLVIFYWGLLLICVFEGYDFVLSKADPINLICFSF